MLGYFWGDNIKVTNNNIYSNGYHGIFIAASSGGLSGYTIEKNLISNNYYCGIWVVGPAFNVKIKNNHFQGNGASGVEFQFVLMSSVKHNNFINNGRNAWFVFSFYNVWSNNYWDDWIGIGPKCIEGLLIGFRNYPDPGDELNIPWINFDRHPAREPYDVSIPYV